MSDPIRSGQAELHLGRQGRLVIPASMRRALGFEPGDTLIVRLDEDHLVVEKAETVKRRLKNLFRAVPASVDLANELIEERRREAAKEDET